MDAITLTRLPSKEAVRAWLKQQIASKAPPPSPEEIKRQLSHNDFLNRAECAR
jgi:hypothetical protein